MMVYMLGIDGLSPQGFVCLLYMSLLVRAPELRPRAARYQTCLLLLSSLSHRACLLIAACLSVATNGSHAATSSGLDAATF